MSGIRLTAIDIKPAGPLAPAGQISGTLKFTDGRNRCTATFEQENDKRFTLKGATCGNDQGHLELGYFRGLETRLSTALRETLRSNEARIRVILADKKTNVTTEPDLTIDSRRHFLGRTFTRGADTIILADAKRLLASRKEPLKPQGDGIPDYLEWKVAGEMILRIEGNSHTLLAGLKSYLEP